MENLHLAESSGRKREAPKRTCSLYHIVRAKRLLVLSFVQSTALGCLGSAVTAGSDHENASCCVRCSLAWVHRVSQVPCLQAWLQPLSVVDWKILQEYCLQALICAGRWTRPDSSVINAHLSWDWIKFPAKSPHLLCL